MKNRKYVTFYNGFLFVLILLNVLPFLAPVFLELAEHFPIFEYPAKLIYFIYSFTCHQFHHRSLHIWDHQGAWCVRDMGIWAGVLMIALLARGGRLKGIRWYWLVPFIIPIALDGGIQTIATMLEVDLIGPTGDPLYVSNNLSRFVTGAIFGIGLSLFISPTMWLLAMEGVEEKSREHLGNVKLKLFSLPPRLKSMISKPIGASIFVFGLLLVGYLSLIQVWSISSVNYLPTDLADTSVRTPATDFYVRRANGVCPSSAEELFNLECFFSAD